MKASRVNADIVFLRGPRRQNCRTGIRKILPLLGIDLQSSSPQPVTRVTQLSQHITVWGWEVFGSDLGSWRLPGLRSNGRTLSVFIIRVPLFLVWLCWTWFYSVFSWDAIAVSPWRGRKIVYLILLKWLPFRSWKVERYMTELLFIQPPAICVWHLNSL